MKKIDRTQPLTGSDRGAETALASARRELAEERERYRDLVELSRDAYLVTDSSGVVREANRAAVALFGVARDEFSGRPLVDFLTESCRSGVLGALRSLARRGRIDDLYVQALSRQTGVAIPVMMTLLAGRTGECRWLIRDETEQLRLQRQAGRLQAERTARQTAEDAYDQLEAVIGQLPVGAMIVEAPSGRVVTYNRAAEELFAYPLPLPESVAEYGDVYHGLHPDGRRYTAVEWPLARAVVSGETVVAEEIEVMLPAGERRTFQFSAAPVRAADGTVTAAVTTFLDVTPRRRQAELDQLLAQVSDLIASSVDYVATLHQVAALCVRSLADHCIVHVEERGEVRALSGAHRDPERQEEVREMLRRNPLDVAGEHPVARALRSGEPQFLAEIGEAELRDLAGEAELLEEMRGLGLRSGVVVPLRARGRTLGTLSVARERGSPAYTTADVGVLQEIARRAALAVDNARLYRAAQQEARARQEVLGVVSHDLRNSLSAAMISAELLLEPAPGHDVAAARRRQVEAIRRGLEHMNRLVEDLLEVDHIERGQLKLVLEVVPVSSLLEAAHELFQPLAQSCALRLTSGITGAPPPPVRGDSARIVQALSNLISNAIKFTPAGGSVALTARADGGAVHFSVSDTGPGIPPADQPHLFDRFWRGTHATARGSGLGLAITRGIVEAHGGRVWVESGVGRGSTFHFTLPFTPSSSGDGATG